MGTAEVQGELWGTRPRDWAEAQEPAWRPIYETLLSRIGILRGKRLLDVGCGSGGALELAQQRGADVTGFDASAALAAVARERLPGARIEIGDMEALPFEAGAFDVVVGFNSFQFAGDIVTALREARRVCSKEGKVAALFWGRKEACELVSGVMPHILSLLPPAPASGPAPFDFGSPGLVEGLMVKAGLVPQESGEFDCVLAYPDTVTTLRALSSAGVVTRVIRQVGEEAVRASLSRALADFTRKDGVVALKNRFRWVIATPD